MEQQEQRITVEKDGTSTMIEIDIIGNDKEEIVKSKPLKLRLMKDRLYFVVQYDIKALDDTEYLVKGQEAYRYNKIVVIKNHISAISLYYASGSKQYIVEIAYLHYEILIHFFDYDKANRIHGIIEQWLRTNDETGDS